MHVVRFAEAPAYDAPGHHDMHMSRLQGREAGPADTVWLGALTLASGGGTTLDASNVEKIYVVLDGEVTVSNGRENVRLRRWDSCRIGPNEARRLHNHTQEPATVLLVMPLQATGPPR
ncbi:cupin domain-containing protein [Mesorhizobium sp. B2-3-3]|nr:cupin domain-containing protein [Mesorhizobium sp. B2-3-3]